jgi:hypothetical protein
LESLAAGGHHIVGEKLWWDILQWWVFHSGGVSGRLWGPTGTDNLQMLQKVLCRRRALPGSHNLVSSKVSKITSYHTRLQEIWWMRGKGLRASTTKRRIADGIRADVQKIRSIL